MAPRMGLWDRMRGVGPGGYRDRAAKKLEREGDLKGAVELYLEAGLRDEAARVLLLRGDADPILERRMAFFDQASTTAESAELGRKAKARRARLAYDLVKGKGAALQSELVVAASDLEAAGEFVIAAEAFALAGDSEGEIRALTSAGAIDKLEERLHKDALASRTENQRTLALKRIQDLDRSAERRQALKIAAEVGESESEERIGDLVREIRQRLVRGPTCNLVVLGEAWTVAFGDELTVGRGEATIVLASRALSRVHLRVRRDESGEIVAEDAGTRNGTFLRGARLGGPVPVGKGLELTLGTEVPCSLEVTASGAVAVTVAGLRYLAPLGPLVAGPFRVRLDGRGADETSFMVLESDHGAPAFRGALELARRVELCYGDEIAAERSGEALIVVGRSQES